MFSGHKKTVSYVHIFSANELSSASTDSTLRSWDIKENKPVIIKVSLFCANLLMGKLELNRQLIKFIFAKKILYQLHSSVTPGSINKKTNQAALNDN